jgi:uncharacterized protein (DUF58 family)
MTVTGLAGMYNIKNNIPDLLPPTEIFADVPAPFRLSVRNTKSYLHSFLIRIEHSSGPFLVFPIVPKQSTCEGSVLLTFPQRGRIPSGKITISSPYPVGFFTRYWNFEIDINLIVFPRPIESKFSRNAEDDVKAAGTWIRREPGVNGELERIYQYSGSEPFRMIHWKLSARHHDLLVKGFGRSSAAPLVIDLNQLAGLGIEERLSRAVWLVQRWVRERPVGLMIADRVLPPGMGSQHGQMLLKELALYDRD